MSSAGAEAGHGTGFMHVISGIEGLTLFRCEGHGVIGALLEAR